MIIKFDFDDGAALSGSWVPLFVDLFEWDFSRLGGGFRRLSGTFPDWAAGSGV
ncbi:MAG: hypothetical protein IJG52_02890 [Lachnospiraceae bacterium]|nr:hypothetical protein [Lachnospiraceae bacterium]